MPPIVASFAGYVHPCGAISVGSVPRHKKSADERRNEVAHNKIELRRLNTPSGTNLADGLARQLDVGQITVTEAVLAISSLGSSSLSNSRNSQINSNRQADLDPPQPSGLENPLKVTGKTEYLAVAVYVFGMAQQLWSKSMGGGR